MDRASFRAYGVSVFSLAALVTMAGPAAAIQNVLIAASDGSAADIADVQSKVAATGLISGGVDTYATNTGTPSADYLRAYAAVLVYDNSPPADPVALGDSLAAYIDCGGGVVVLHGSFTLFYGMQGRFITGGYCPLQVGNPTQGASTLTLGAIFNASHPVLSGVAAFSGGAASLFNDGAIATGGTLIANWSNGAALIAETPGLSGRVVALNFFAPSTTVQASGWDATTDGARLMANALVYVMDTTPPTATVAAPATSAGTAVTVTATATCLASANLHYRKAGGSATYTVLAMAESAPGAGDWSAQIPDTDVGTDGVQYYVDLSDGRNTATVPVDAPTTCSSIRVSRTTTMALAAGAYKLAGVPFAPSNGAPAAVFDELGAYDPTRWRYGTWNGSSYQEGSSAAPVSPGQGFWIIAKDAASIGVAGSSTVLATDFQIALRPGFNQITDPYSFPVATTALVLPAAVERNLFSYTGSGYAAGNATLSPGVGYWIKNNGPGNQTITIPMATAPSPSPVARPGTLPDGESGWCVCATAAAGSFVDADNRFGERPGATDAKDAFDFSDPPAPPEGYVMLSLLGDDGTPLLSDYRPQSGDGARWRLQLTSDQTGQPFHVRFDVEHALPSDWVLEALGPGGLREVNLLTSGALTGTVGSGLFTRDWTIVAGTPAWAQSAREALGRDATEFSFSAPTPNPARATSFDLALPQAVHVDVRVFDVAGRIVRTLVDATMDRGYHLIEWNGADASGRHVADGVYFVRLQTSGQDETRKVVLLR